MAETSELVDRTAVDMAALVARREISCEELVTAHIRQIEAVNPALNAIVTFLPDAALDAARRLDAALATHKEEVPVLAGLPVAHKDLVPTRGVRTTFGSPIYADFVPQHDALLVERLREAGAIMVGKTNTPEFGAGSQTFNEVFGATANPFDTEKTCGGSSGGAAVALASRMLPIADGSDTGGSLRNPAAFCNVVGFRVSPGRVPHWPSTSSFSTLSVHGPMARTVRDCALMLSVLAPPDPRDPHSVADDGSQFLEFARDESVPDLNGTRIAIAPDFAGQLPVQPAVSDVIAQAGEVLGALGARISEGCPDFSDAEQVFHVMRAQAFVSRHRAHLAQHREALKDTIIWNTEAGLALTAEEIADASERRAALYARIGEFMRDHDYLVLPTTQVLPFSLDTDWVREINGVSMPTYISWMQSCCYLSVTALPCISVPAGFADGLPVGLQIVGRRHDDLGVLRVARAFEAATDYWKKLPASAGLS